LCKTIRYGYDRERRGRKEGRKEGRRAGGREEGMIGDGRDWGKGKIYARDWRLDA